MEDSWAPCPRCGSKRAQKQSKWAGAIALFGSAGCLIWVGFLIPLLWFLVPVLLILSFLMVFTQDTWQCQDCKHSWIVKRAKSA